MPEKNRIYRARIQGYTSEGLGVARIDGQAVFVHRALRDEECDVLILKVLKNAAFGKVVQVYGASPHRREPDCPWYGRCGGCDFRHMDREEELYAKRQRVQDALARIGGSDVTVETIRAGEQLHYRNKSQYPVSADGQVGFYKARSHQVIPVEWCLIQKPQADAAAEALRRYIREYGVPCYDERIRRGLVRHLYVRTNTAGQSLVCVLVNGKRLPHEDALVSLMRQALPEAVGVVLGVNTQPTGAVLGSEYRTLWGADVLEDTLCGLSFRLSVPSFYQVNHDMAEVLYDTAVDFAGLTGSETVRSVLRRGDHHAGDDPAGGQGHRRGARGGGHRQRPGECPAQRHRERGVLLRRRGGRGSGLRRQGAAAGRDLRGPAPEGAEPGGHRGGGADGAGAHRIRLLRPGHAGPGREAVRRAGLQGRPCGGGGHVPRDGKCGIRGAAGERPVIRRKNTRERRSRVLFSL